MRRMPAVACALILAGVACSAPGRGTSMHGSPPASSPTPVPVASSSASSPSSSPGGSVSDTAGGEVTIVPGGTQAFPDGAAYVTLDSIDTAQPAAVFAVTCGRTVSGNRVIPPGFYRVDLGNATFEVTSNTADPAAGHVSDITFGDWVKETATRKRWHVEVRPQGTVVSDGPTYDICANASS